MFMQDLCLVPIMNILAFVLEQKVRHQSCHGHEDSGHSLLDCESV